MSRRKKGTEAVKSESQAHVELLVYLEAHRDACWTDTFLDIMTYVKANQRHPRQEQRSQN